MEWRLILAVPLLGGLWFMYKLMKAKLDISLAKLMHSTEDTGAEITIKTSKTTIEGHYLNNLEVGCSGKSLKECLETIDVLLLMNKK